MTLLQFSQTILEMPILNLLLRGHIMHPWGRFIAILRILVLCLLSARAGAQAQAGDLTSKVFEIASPPNPIGEASSATEPRSLEPLEGGGAKERWDASPAGTSHQAPFSRIGIGANVSPLGIGINGTTVLSDYFDARLMGNFFSYTSTQFEIEGFRGAANVHLASMAASLDWYPFNSVWRLSPGVMFYNGNQFTANALIESGNSFTLNGKKFYSADAKAGATPLTGSGVLGLHPQPIAFTAAIGFGKFIPRSDRHWSFPSEFGVVFMGAPTANVAISGWACLDEAGTQCSNVGDLTNPVAQQFNSALQAQLTKWRRDLGKVDVYPMFSYSVVYSFNIR
jgi:hypothetical protein